MEIGWDGGGKVANGEYHTYPPVGRCIYCGSGERLEDEHIIPYALNGNWVLPKASCRSCAEVIAKYETRCLKENLKPLRTRLKMQSRHKVRASLCAKIAKRDGQIEHREIPEGDYPVMAFALHLPLAGILTGEPPSDTFPSTLQIRTMDDGGQFAKHITEGEAARLGTFDPTAFLRMLTKMSYAYSAAEIGTESLHPMLLDLVFARAPNSAFLTYLVGSESIQEPRNANRLLLVDHTIRDVVYTLVYIDLRCLQGMVRYHVVVRVH